MSWDQLAHSLLRDKHPVEGPSVATSCHRSSYNLPSLCAPSSEPTLAPHLQAVILCIDQTYYPEQAESCTQIQPLKLPAYPAGVIQVVGVACGRH